MMKHMHERIFSGFSRLHERHDHHHHRPDDGDVRGERGFGPSGHFGRRSRMHSHGERGARARRGGWRYLLMEALASGPKNGYDIIKHLEERSNGRYSPSPGVIYPTLQLLAETNLVRAEQVGDRRIFHLTEEGQQVLEAHKEEVAEFWSQFTPPSTAAQTEIRFVAEELEYLGQSVWGALRGASDEAIIRKVRSAIEKCRNEVRSVVTSSSTDETV